MVSIGLDCSTTSTGYSVFDGLQLIKYGVIKPDNSNWRERLYVQSQTLGAIFDEYKPSIIYVEDVPVSNKGGALTCIKLGAVQGMVYGVGASRHINMQFITPSQWRSPLGLFDGTREGTKRNEMKKKSVDKANELFGLNLIYKSPTSKFNDDDISDAILLCYSQIKTRAFGK